MIAELLSWPVVLPAALALIDLGFLVVFAMRDQVDANWARLSFLAGVGYIWVKTAMWGITTSHSK